MSFSDISSSNAKNSNGRAPVKPQNGVDSAVSQLSDSLQRLQKNCSALKEKVSEMRKKQNVNLAGKKDLDRQVGEMKDFENHIKNQLDSEMRHLDLQPRTAVSQKRIALGKLSKDFERLKGTLSAITNECNAIRVTSFPESNGSLRSGNEDGIVGSDKQHLNQLQLIQTLQGKDVDEAIQRERERDLRKINLDLAMVNEMFKDMAEIVDQQGIMVEEIVVSTEKSHERAQAGLEQVQKAAASQQPCIIS